MASFKDSIISISGTIDEGVVTDYNLNKWTNMSFGEIRNIVPATNFEPLSVEETFTWGNITAELLGQHVGEFNKIIAVYCDLHSTFQHKKTTYDSWEKLLGSNNQDVWSNNIPRFALAREINSQGFLEGNYMGSNDGKIVVDYDYTSQLNYSTGTPLDPVWTRMSGGIKCAPYNWYFKVLWIDTPNFNVDVELSNVASGFLNVPSEVRNVMAIYVARMIKIYELDNLTAPTFHASVEIEDSDYLDADNYGFLSEVSSFSGIMEEIVSDSESYIEDEDTELSAASLKAKETQLATLKTKVSAADLNITKKLAVLQKDVTVYQQNLSRYQQQASKINKDLEQLSLKYNESIASLNGQTFSGKASSSELDKLKREVKDLKDNLGRRRG